MIEVQLPDGSIAEFPDGTAPDVMKAAIQKRFPVQAPADAAPMGAATAPAAQDPYLADLPVPGGGPGYVEPGPMAVPTPTPFNETAFAQGTSGVNEGIASVLGLPVDLAQGALRLGAAGINAATGGDIQLPVNAIGGSQSIKDLMAPSIRPTSEDPGNQVIRRIGQEVGATLVPGASIVAKSATPIRSAVGQAATALGSGAAAGAVQQVTDNPYAEIAAQILGGLSVAGAAQAGKKAITPNPISAEKQAVNDVLAREGVELSPGQMTGSPTLRNMESELGGPRLSDLTERQADQFTQAALSRAGISAPRATPEVMDNAFTSIGKQFDDLAVRNTLRADQTLGQELGGVVRDYFSMVNESARAPVIESTLRDIAAAVRKNGGTISGDAYQAMRSRLNAQARKATDASLGDALFGIQRSLDDAMERSIAAANPADLGAWQQARSDYRNLLVLEQAASRAGEATAMGVITPANLRSAVSQQNKRAYVRGQGDFAELARAGVAGMSPLPNSGTAARLAVRGMTSGLPATLGALAGNSVADTAGAVAGFALGSQAPNALAALALSGPGKAYLTNQLLAGKTNLAEMLGGPTVGAASNAVAAMNNRPPNALAALRANALN